MWKICHHAKSENIMQPSQQAFLKSKIFARKVKEKYWVHQVYTLDYLLVGSWKVAGFFKKIALLRRERERERKGIWLGQILWFFGQTIWKILLLECNFFVFFQIPNVVTCLAASQKGFSMKCWHFFLTCLKSKKDGTKNVVPF